MYCPQRSLRRKNLSLHHCRSDGFDTLSIQLKQLENDELISKVVYGEKPPLVAIYSLTDLGKSFLPILDALTQWGNKIVLEKGTFLIE